MHRFNSIEDANQKRDQILIGFKDQLVSARKECRESVKTGEGTARGRLALRKIDASQFKDQMHEKIEEMRDERSKIDQLVSQISAKDVSLAESDIDSYVDAESEKYDHAKKRLNDRKKQAKEELVESFGACIPSDERRGSKHDGSVGLSSMCPSHVEKNKGMQLGEMVMLETTRNVDKSFIIYSSCNLVVEGYDPKPGLFPKPPCEEDGYARSA